MRSLLHILVFALSVSAACVKRQKPKGDESSLNTGDTGASSSGPGRQLLETTDANTLSNGGDGNGADGGSGSLNGTETLPPADLTNNTSPAGSDDTSDTSNTPTSSKEESDTTSSNGGSDTTSSNEGSDTTSSNRGGDSSAGTSGFEQPNLSFNGPKKVQSVSTLGNSIVDGASDQTAGPEGNATISAPGAGNCGALKGVCFNGGMKAEMYDKITTATTWTTFQLTLPGGGASPRTAGDFIPMMAFARNVADAIKMVNSDNPPEWLLTFNEPDFSYQGVTPPTPRMDPKEAAAAIVPLLADRGTKTKFVAPATADSSGNWQELFFEECGCRDFFSAYNVHSYHRTSEAIINDVSRFRSKHHDKPLWITEVAPGEADCTVGWDEAGKFMKDIYKFAKDSGFVDRVYWNSGNAITNGDTNICNSWLMDPEGKPGPLLDMYEKMDCT